MASNGDATPAPAYSIPQTTFLCVEHPFDVDNLEKCLETLGGESGMSKLLDPQENVKPINLHLCPQDQLSAPVESIPVSTENLLLKITVPKRTGRKRKRGSSDEFTSDADIETTAAQNGLAEGNQPLMRFKRIDCRQLRRSLRDNVGKFEIEVLGSIQLSHRWRNMPDFVYSTSQSALATEFRRTIFPFDFLKIKQFNQSNAITPDRTDDLIPPPNFSNQNLPFIYGFRQNPAMKHIISTKDGTVQAINTQTPPKTYAHHLDAAATPVPTGFHPRCAPVASLDPRIMRNIGRIMHLFHFRPIWTRRALINSLDEPNIRYLAKYAIPYVAYHFRNGPWRDSLVRLGVDPRTSPEYRKYQTIIFKLNRTTTFGTNPPPMQSKGKKPYTRPPQKKHIRNDKSHIFNGQSIAQDGKTWAFCDLTDPLLAKILDTKEIRETCEVNADGWYNNGTLAKLRVIMRAKIQRITQGREYSDIEFGRLLPIPDIISSENKRSSALIPKDATSEEIYWASRIRSIALTRYDTVGNKIQGDGDAEGDHVESPNDGVGDVEEELGHLSVDEENDEENDEATDEENDEGDSGEHDGFGEADEDEPIV